MTNPELLEGQAVQAVYEFAARYLGYGASPEEVRSMLVVEGLDQETAAAVVARVTEELSEAMRDAADRNTLHGALWCIGGGVVTAATYSMASPGGTFVVAWGAIVFGAIQFLHGLSAKRPTPRVVETGRSVGQAADLQIVATDVEPESIAEPSWANEVGHGAKAVAKVIAGIATVLVLVTALAWLFSPHR